jgi:hypothetical protein
MQYEEMELHIKNICLSVTVSPKGISVQRNLSTRKRRMSLTEELQGKVEC